MTLVRYDVLFTLEKLNYGSNIWEINSPIQGFNFIKAIDMNGNDIINPAINYLA